MNDQMLLKLVVALVILLRKKQYQSFPLCVEVHVICDGLSALKYLYILMLVADQAVALFRLDL